MITPKIPLVRDALLRIADGLRDGYDPLAAAVALENLVPQLYRAPAVRRTRVKSRKMTPALARNIRAYAALNPDLSHQELGDLFAVNTGRISEALHHLR